MMLIGGKGSGERASDDRQPPQNPPPPAAPPASLSTSTSGKHTITEKAANQTSTNAAKGKRPDDCATIVVHRSEQNLRKLPPLSQPVIQLIRQAGFGSLLDMPFMQLDLGSLTALVLVHFPSAEATVTLQDVEVITGLPINGRPVIGKTDLPWEQMVEQLLGCELPEEMRKGNKLLEDLEVAGQYSWGSACLASLYRYLCHSSEAKNQDVGGMFVLLQVWAWERLPYLAPGRLGEWPPRDGVALIGRWDDEFHSPNLATHVVGHYRHSLDMQRPDEVVWQPYSEELIESLPPFCRAGRAIWRAKVPPINFAIVEMHQPERVMRQFGFRQLVPPQSQARNALHGLGSDNSDPQAAGIRPAYPGEKLQNWTSQKIVRARKFWDPKIRPFDPNDVTILAHDEYDFDVELDFELMGFEIDTCDAVPEEIKLMADKHDDRKTPNIEEIETINLGTVESPREVKIGTNLNKWQRKEFKELLEAYKDVFAWSYEDMPAVAKLLFEEGNVVTNNIAEYEACILGLRMALQYEILELTVWGDSDLIIQQSNETFKTRDPKLAPYHQKVKELRQRFNDNKFIHIPRTDNSFADALATLAAAIQFDEGEEIPAIQIELRHSPAYCSAVAEELDGHPWYHDIKRYMQSQTYPEDASSNDQMDGEEFPQPLNSDVVKHYFV
ncbi:hypothetical protein Vadar_031754 [Vaccinium darrowii]|uniref:Uncharacterized protein n=1 Tax=Vaccinium darrowii TaxID=229202 RepID=A0ACB7ZNT1_9ERIC|nr:hypothetical protein Vadar_031754 [Vaccinium darrowii]